MEINTSIDNWLLDTASWLLPDISHILQIPPANLRIQFGDQTTITDDWTPSLVKDRIAGHIRENRMSIVEFQDDEHAVLSKECGNELLLDTNFFLQQKHYLKLTTDGSRLWEDIFEPDWDRFHTVDQKPVGDEIVQMTLKSGSEQHLSEILLHSLDYFGLERKFGLQRFKFGKRDRWSPVYWKKLSGCYFVRFVCKELKKLKPPTNQSISLFLPWGRHWPSDGSDKYKNKVSRNND